MTSIWTPSLQVTTDLRGVHICDMGIAKLKVASEATATVTPNPKGTYPYMAPEMFAPSHRGTAVDVYAFGCLLIKLLGQRKVWAELTSVQIMQKVCGSFSVTPVPPSVNHFPTHYQSLCKSCCELDPANRLTITAVITMLEAYTV